MIGASYLLLFYLLSYIFVGSPRVSIPMFLLFSVFGLLLPSMVRIDGRLFLKSVMMWTIFSILKLDKIFFTVVSWADVISMDASYAFLPPVLTNVIYLLTYYSKESKLEKFFTILISVVNFLIFIQLFKYGSRGPLLALFLAFMFVFFHKHNSKFNRLKLQLPKLVAFLLLLPLFFVLIEYVIDFLSFYGISSHAIEKAERLSSEGDISNGRNNLVGIALNGFFDNWLLGNGLDRFDANTGLLYPHNFILQSLYDGGLLFSLLLFIPLLNSIKSIYRKCTFDEYMVYTVMFFISVPYALFSQDMWANANLWLFFGILLSRNIVYTNQKMAGYEI